MTNPADGQPFVVAFERDDDTLVASPSGELDLATAPELARAVREQGGYRCLVIDLRRLTFMDSTGLRLLIAERERAQQEGHELQIVRGTDEVDKVLRLTRLDEQLPIRDG